MIFTTPGFVLFALIFFAIYAALRGIWKKVFLLGASYYFYGTWNPYFLLLLIGSSVLDFYLGRAIALAGDEALRRRLLVVSVVVNLTVLGFFKYFNFFVDSAVSLFSAFGLEVHPRVLDIVLPVGISFYTFQSMSYAIDIYRREMSPADSLLEFCLYVAFFPQLVAGPIERAQRLLPQLCNLERPCYALGWGLIALGAFKKVVIADRVAALVTLAYASPDDTYGPALWIATYAFALQIYCDFSGYTDIAVGVGRLMGVHLMQNFSAPYAADDPSDFWRRWHISLSTWLRDYLYIPLGGNRHGPFKQYRNLIITMLLGGLWHGAAWNFVLWGGYHGLLLVVYRIPFVARLADYRSRRKFIDIALAVFRRLLFFHLICLSWAIFRAQSLHDCVTILTKMISFPTWDWAHWLGEVKLSGEGAYLAVIVGVVGFMFLMHNLFRFSPGMFVEKLWKKPLLVKLVFVMTLLAAAIVLAPEEPPPFIYFQF